MEGVPGQWQFAQSHVGRDSQQSNHSNCDLQIEVVVGKHDHNLEEEAGDGAQLFVH